MSETKLKVILPIGILAIGVATTIVMVRSRAPVETRAPEDYAPLVRVVTAATENRRLSVVTHGTVKPRTESVLVAEVSGRITRVAPTFAAGSFFEEGDVLVDIDPRDYELAVVTAEGQVAQAKVREELEEAQAEVAREEWKALGRGEESPLATRELQLQEARAALAAAEAALEQAKRNLRRTKVRAPFAGRVRETRVDVGQFVSPGTPIASIFAVDYVEIRLPIPDADLAYLNLPINYRGDREQKTGPVVILRADFAGEHHQWEGRIVRVEGEIDPVTRMVHAVAQVEDPYGRDAGADPMPLAVGLFVEAEIMGREVEGVIAVPRAAIRSDGHVFIVDDEDRLRRRQVKILRLGRNEAIIRSGVEPGERICVSPLETATDGMKVRAVEPTTSNATARGETRS